MKKFVISEQDLDDLRVYIRDVDKKVENLDASNADSVNNLLYEIDNIYFYYGMNEDDEPNDIGRKYEEIRDRIYADNCLN